MKTDKLISKFRVDRPDRFRLEEFDCADTGGLDKAEAKAMLVQDTKRLAKLQERLYVDGRWALLIVLQGMDTAGKDGVIEHVMSGVNPQGCEVTLIQGAEHTGAGARFPVAGGAAAAGTRTHRHFQSLTL